MPLQFAPIQTSPPPPGARGCETRVRPTAGSDLLGAGGRLRVARKLPIALLFGMRGIRKPHSSPGTSLVACTVDCAVGIVTVWLSVGVVVLTVVALKLSEPANRFSFAIDLPL